MGPDVECTLFKNTRREVHVLCYLHISGFFPIIPITYTLQYKQVPGSVSATTFLHNGFKSLCCFLSVHLRFCYR